MGNHVESSEHLYNILGFFNEHVTDNLILTITNALIKLYIIDVLSDANS